MNQAKNTYALYDIAKSKGYELPAIYLWNVGARKDTFLSQSEKVYFVSGQSPSTFKQICNAVDGMTAYDLMIQTLNNPAYDKVRI